MTLVVLLGACTSDGDGKPAATPETNGQSVETVGASTTMSSLPPATQEPPVASTTTQAPGREGSPDPFVPSTARTGNTNSTTVVLPNGQLIDISWPSSLDIMSYGVRPHTWIASEGGYSTDLWFRHGEPADVMQTFSNPRIISELTGADESEVVLWRVAGSGQLDFLSYDAGAWTVLVPNPRSASGQPRIGDDDLAFWASRLIPREDPTGLPVVDTEADLFLAPVGDPQGNQIWLFSPHGVIKLVAAPCDLDGVSEPSDDWWCASDGDVIVQVEGDVGYQARLRDELRVALGPFRYLSLVDRVEKKVRGG